MTSLQLCASRRFAIRWREADRRLPDIRMAEPCQHIEHGGDARHRHRRRSGVSRREPSRRADLGLDDRGRDRCNRRPPADAAADPDPDRAGAAGHFAGVGGLAPFASAGWRLSRHHRVAGARHLLLDVRLELLPPADPWLGSHLGFPGRQSRRAVADHHPCGRARRRPAGHRGGADHARHHPDRRAADGAGACGRSVLLLRRR